MPITGDPIEALLAEMKRTNAQLAELTGLYKQMLVGLSQLSIEIKKIPKA